MLTIASAVGIPSTLMAGLYGMNFKFMPEPGWARCYPFGLALILPSALIPLIWFKWQGWFWLRSGACPGCRWPSSKMDLAREAAANRRSAAEPSLRGQLPTGEMKLCDHRTITFGVSMMPPAAFESAFGVVYLASGLHLAVAGHLTCGLSHFAAHAGDSACSLPLMLKHGTIASGR